MNGGVRGKTKILNSMFISFIDLIEIRVMSTILSIENPDLVVLTGDLITGNNIIDNATAYWKEMVSPMVQAKIPWAVAFGNHDSLASGKGGSRVDLMLVCNGICMLFACNMDVITCNSMIPHFPGAFLNLDLLIFTESAIML